MPWVFALTYLGFILGENWDRIGYYLHYLDYAVALAFIVGAVYLVFSLAFLIRGCNWVGEGHKEE